MAGWANEGSPAPFQGVIDTDDDRAVRRNRSTLAMDPGQPSIWSAVTIRNNPEETPVTLVNTEIKPFSTTAFHNGEFVNVSSDDRCIRVL